MLALKHLINYCDLKGCYVNDEMVCVFSSELQTDDEDYFGENKVAYYFFEPAVKEDCAIILDYVDFYRVVKENFEKNLSLFNDKKNDVLELLEKLKKNLNVLSIDRISGGYEVMVANGDTGQFGNNGKTFFLSLPSNISIKTICNGKKHEVLARVMGLPAFFAV